MMPLSEFASPSTQNSDGQAAPVIFSCRWSTRNVLQGKRELFGDSPGSLLIIHGKPVPERQEEPHAVSLQKHLLGYEFPDTIMLLTPKSFVVHATAKKRALASLAVFR